MEKPLSSECQNVSNVILRNSVQPLHHKTIFIKVQLFGLLLCSLPRSQVNVSVVFIPLEYKCKCSCKTSLLATVQQYNTANMYLIKCIH